MHTYWLCVCACVWSSLQLHAHVVVEVACFEDHAPPGECVYCVLSACVIDQAPPGECVLCAFLVYMHTCWLCVCACVCLCVCMCVCVCVCVCLCVCVLQCALGKLFPPMWFADNTAAGRLSNSVTVSKQCHGIKTV